MKQTNKLPTLRTNLLQLLHMSTLPFLPKHNLSLQVTLSFLDFLFQNLQVIIHNKLRNIHSHQRTCFHRADETLDTAGVVETACELRVFECDAGKFVGVGVPDFGVIPGNRVAAVCGYGCEVFGDLSVLEHD